jgi:hypothetical protein
MRWAFPPKELLSQTETTEAERIPQERFASRAEAQAYEREGSKSAFVGAKAATSTAVMYGPRDRKAQLCHITQASRVAFNP